MARIQVNPEELVQVGNAVRSAAAEFRQGFQRAESALSRLDARSASLERVRGQVMQARGQALALSQQAERLVYYLRKKAQDFQEADTGGSTLLHAISAAMRQLFKTVTGILGGVGTLLGQWWRLGTLFRPQLPPPVCNVDWVRRAHPDLFPDNVVIGGSVGAGGAPVGAVAGAGATGVPDPGIDGGAGQTQTDGVVQPPDQPVTGADSQAGADNQTGADTQTGSQSPTGVAGQPGAGSQAGAVGQTGAGSQAGPETPTGVGTQTGAGSQAGAETQTGAGTQPGAETQTGAGTQPGAGSQTGPAPGPSGSAPSPSDSAPGPSGSAPGPSGSAPGHTQGAGPVQSGTVPPGETAAPPLAAIGFTGVSGPEPNVGSTGTPGGIADTHVSNGAPPPTAPAMTIAGPNGTTVQINNPGTVVINTGGAVPPDSRAAGPGADAFAAAPGPNAFAAPSHEPGPSASGGGHVSFPEANAMPPTPSTGGYVEQAGAWPINSHAPVIAGANPAGAILSDQSAVTGTDPTTAGSSLQHDAPVPSTAAGGPTNGQTVPDATGKPEQSGTVVQPAPAASAAAAAAAPAEKQPEVSSGSHGLGMTAALGGAAAVGLGAAGVVAGRKVLGQQNGARAGSALGGGGGLGAGGAGRAGGQASGGFWEMVGEAPTLELNGQRWFRPEIQTWADEFNANVENHWRTRLEDYASSINVDQLVMQYRITPAKLEQLWAASRRHGTDPKLVAAMLKHEGTGYFRTPPLAEFLQKGRLPEVSFERELEATLDGQLLGKLRLYPRATRDGFAGSVIDWIGWYTPLDTPSYEGRPVLYSPDAQWSEEVTKLYRALSETLQTGSPDPVTAYLGWIKGNEGSFSPRYVQGQFQIRPGLASAAPRPEMCSRQSNARPSFPGTYGPKEGFWWFPAPDAACWQIARK